MKSISSIIIVGTLLTQASGSPTQLTKEAAKCYGGGMEQYPPLSGKNTPPCWYKQPSGNYHCYDYKPNTGECPWPGYEDPKPE